MLGSGCVQFDAVPDRAAQQIVDRLVKSFATDVPQRNVDTTDGVGRCTPRTHVGESSEDLVPDFLDLDRVVSFDHGSQFPENGADCPVGHRVRSGHFSPTGNTLVGLHFSTNMYSPGRPK